MMAPRPEETILIYIAATSGIVSTAIVVEREEARHAYCNTLGIWLPLIAFHFINMCIIYVIMPLSLKHTYATF